MSELRKLQEVTAGLRKSLDAANAEKSQALLDCAELAVLRDELRADLEKGALDYQNLQKRLDDTVIEMGEVVRALAETHTPARCPYNHHGMCSPCNALSKFRDYAEKPAQSPEIPPVSPEIPPVMVKEIKYPDGAGGMTLKLSHGVVPFMASEFVKFFKDSGGVNYVEFTLVDGKSPEMGPFTVTIQRMMGKTPGMVVAELRDRISELEKAGAK